MDQHLIDSLRAAKQSLADEQRPEIVSRVHGTGRLTARERIKALLDPESAVDYGTIAARSSAGDFIPEAGGVDCIGTIDGQVVVASSTDYTDHGGGYGAGRLGRLFALAGEHQWPMVLFVDGGGSRARHPRTGQGHIEFSGAIGRFTPIEGNAELSGRVPMIAIVSGPAFAGHASLAGFSDFLIATRGSSIGIGGPPMVEAALGTRLTPNELAGVEMHETTGGIDLLVENDVEAIHAARTYLGYYRDRPDGKIPMNAGEIDRMVPEEGAYDMVPILEALVDQGSLFPIRPRFASSVITALARINGRSVGILASQPAVDEGYIDEDGASKICRFVELCDCYEFPIIALVDTPGCRTRRKNPGGGSTSVAGISRWHARPLIAHQHRSVPLFSIRVRRSGGLGGALMTGFSSSPSVPPLNLAWPTLILPVHDGFAAVQHGIAIDDVVAPSETRDRILRVLRHIRSYRSRSEKKHPIDSW